MSNNQTIKNLRVKNNETSISQVLPIGADAVNVELANRRNLQETIGNIDSRVNGSITNNLEVLSSAVQTLDSIKADTAMIGSPLVAGTASQMIDTSHIYVYTGSESGYTAGNWYYHNGTNWVSGGVYNSTAVETDKTLKVENVAADSRAAGNMVLVSQTQPAAASNKIWIDPDAREVLVPSMDDFDTLAGSVADLYDQTSTYAIGDYCMYEGQLYKCSTAINTAQDWTAAHWTAQVLTDNIQTDLSSKVNSPGSNGTSGQVLTTNGNGTTSWTTPLTVDNTLSQTGKAADAKKTGDEIAELKDDLAQIEGISDEVKQTLLACFRHVAFLDDDDDYYGNLYDALYPNTGLALEWSFLDGTLPSVSDGFEVTNDGYTYSFNNGLLIDSGNSTSWDSYFRFLPVNNKTINRGAIELLIKPTALTYTGSIYCMLTSGLGSVIFGIFVLEEGIRWVYRTGSTSIVNNVVGVVNLDQEYLIRLEYDRNGTQKGYVNNQLMFQTSEQATLSWSLNGTRLFSASGGATCLIKNIKYYVYEEA